jgi:coenzyme F420 hydrogenase subunit beta
MSPLGTQVAMHRRKIPVEQIKEFKYRGAGWPGFMQVQKKNGEEYLEPYFDYFDIQFACYEMHRCNLCIDALGELSDISCGDAWLPEYKTTDDQGSSVIIVRSKTGEDYLDTIVGDDIFLQQLSVSKTAQSQWKANMWKREWFKPKSFYYKLAGSSIPTYIHKLPDAGIGDYFGAAKLLTSRYLYRLWHKLRGYQRGI